MTKTAVQTACSVAFRGSEVAAFAGVVAVNDQSEQPFDARPGALQALALHGISQGAEGSLAEVFAASDADVAPATRRALLS